MTVIKAEERHNRSSDACRVEPSQCDGESKWEAQQRKILI